MYGPQQTAEPSERSPQVWKRPLLMEMNVSPWGGVLLEELSPQHVAEPSGCRSQIRSCSSPNTTGLEGSLRGGINSGLPQQTGEPSARRAQVWFSPLLIVLKVSPCGGDA